MLMCTMCRLHDVRKFIRGEVEQVCMHLNIAAVRCHMWLH